MSAVSFCLLGPLPMNPVKRRPACTLSAQTRHDCQKCHVSGQSSSWIIALKQDSRPLRLSGLRMVYTRFLLMEREAFGSPEGSRLDGSLGGASDP